MLQLSIIMPVYNVGDYLALTLESVFAQTYQKWELICINDGSTDNSLEILRAAQNQDKRIKIITEKNAGPSRARNVGIMAAQGEYLCFLDSDDLLEHNACETIVNTFISSQADVLTYGATVYPEFRNYTWLNDVLSPRNVTYNGFHPDLLFEESSRPFPWRTACRTSFLRKNALFFDETLKLGEDQAFHFAVYPRSNKTVLISDKLVKYRAEREGSLMNSLVKSKGRDEQRLTQHVEVVMAIFHDWKKLGIVDLYAKELINWTIDFLLIELAKQENDFKKKMYSLIRQVWIECLSKASLIQLKQNRIVGPLVLLVLDNKYKSKAYFKRFMYFVHLSGFATVAFGTAYRYLVRFLHPVRIVARRLLPKFSAKKQRAIYENVWDANEELARQKATYEIISGSKERQAIQEAFENV